MADGRTSWWAKDAAWWRREPVVELLEEVGLAGPCVVDWLACEAKAQNAGGVVKAGERTIARALGIDLVTVGHALSHAVTVGLLDDMERDGRTFTCRISGWRSEQERAGAATRKAREREKTASSHGESRPVTAGHKMSHKQDKTVHNNYPPNPPAGGRQRDIAEYEQALAFWTQSVVPEADLHYGLPGARAVLGVLKAQGKPTTAEAVRWVAGHSPTNHFGLSDEARAAIRREFTNNKEFTGCPQ